MPDQMALKESNIECCKTAGYKKKYLNHSHIAESAAHSVGGTFLFRHFILQSSFFRVYSTVVVERNFEKSPYVLINQLEK